MQRVGHTSYDTTKRYIDLEGVVFPEDGDRLEAYLRGEREESLSEPSQDARPQASLALHDPGHSLPRRGPTARPRSPSAQHRTARFAPYQAGGERRINR